MSGPIIVTGPDGSENEFPAGTPDDVITRAMEAQYGGGQPAERPSALGAFRDQQAATREQGRQGRASFTRGAQRIVEGDVSGQEVADLGETFVRSVAAPIGGDYVAAGAENIARAASGQPTNPNALADQRARRRELAEGAPGVAEAGDAASFVGAGASLMRRVPGLLPTRATTLGGKAANTLRVGGVAAAETGVGSLAKGATVEEAAGDAATAFVVAPALGKIIQTGGSAVAASVGSAADTINRRMPRQLRRTTNQPAVGALNVLTERLRIPAGDVEAAINRLRAETGMEPTLSQVMDPQTLRRLVPVIRTSEDAADVFAGSVRRLEQEMATTAPAAIRQGAAPVSTTGEVDVLTRAMDEVMTDIRHVPITSQVTAPLFSRPEVARLLNRTLEGRRMMEAIDAADGGDVSMQLGDFDNVVRNFKAFSRNKTDELGRLAGEVADELANELSRQNPAYAGAYSEYMRAMRRVEGLEAGIAARGERPADIAVDRQRAFGVDPRTAQDAETADLASIRAQGMAEGRVDDLATRASTRSGAAGVIDEVQQPINIERNRVLLGDTEAERLRQMGESSVGAMQRARSLDVNARRQEFPGEGAEIALSSIPLVAGRFSGGFAANVAGNVLTQLNRMRVPPGAARDLAEAMTTNDQATVQEFIRRIARNQEQREALNQLAAQAAAAMTAAQSSASADGQ